MSLDRFLVAHPEQRLESTTPADKYGNVSTKFAAEVQHGIEEFLAFKHFVTIEMLNKDGYSRRYAVGKSLVGVVEPGVTPDGTTTDFGSHTIFVERQIYTRFNLADQTAFLTKFDARAEVALEQARSMAMVINQAMMIAMAKAALTTVSPYGVEGFNGGSTVVCADPLDPAALTASFGELFAVMGSKEVSPQESDMFIVCSHQTQYLLLQAEHIINKNYVTANGTKFDKAPYFEQFGVPVIAAANFIGGANITAASDKKKYPAIMLAGPLKPNQYFGDFTKIVALVCGRKAIWAAAHQMVQTQNFWDELSFTYVVDARMMFGADVDRPEYAGAILKP